MARSTTVETQQESDCWLAPYAPRCAFSGRCSVRGVELLVGDSRGSGVVGGGCRSGGRLGVDDGAGLRIDRPIGRPILGAWFE